MPNQSEISLVSGMETGVRTFLVFLDLPIHYEFRVSNMPLLPESTVIEFALDLVDPADPKSKKRRVEGPHVVMRRKLVYSTSRASSIGLTQYLEFSKI